MRKFLFFIISLFAMTSCVVNTKSVGHFDDMLQGMWQINNEMRILTIKNDSFKIERLYNVMEYKGNFINNSIPDDPPRWIWENAEEHELSIHWFCKGKEGDMKYIEHVEMPDLNETMIVIGLPFSNNEVDTLHRIIDLNPK